MECCRWRPVDTPDDIYHLSSQESMSPKALRCPTGCRLQIAWAVAAGGGSTKDRVQISWTTWIHRNSQENHWKRTSDFMYLKLKTSPFPPAMVCFSLDSPCYLLNTHVYWFLPRLPCCHVPNVVVISLATPWSSRSHSPQFWLTGSALRSCFKKKNWEPLTPRCGDSPLCLNQAVHWRIFATVVGWQQDWEKPTERMNG